MSGSVLGAIHTQAPIITLSFMATIGGLYFDPQPCSIDKAVEAKGMSSVFPWSHV